MSTALAVDRSRVCAFLSPGGRGCTIPRSNEHPYLCAYHARKEAQASAAHKVGQDIAHSLSTRYISHNDLAVALAQTISATAQRHISSRTASSIANLSRTLLHAIAGAQQEYIETFGEDAWTEKIATNLSTLRPAKPADSLRPDPEDLGEYTDEAAEQAEDESGAETKIAPEAQIEEQTEDDSDHANSTDDTGDQDVNASGEPENAEEETQNEDPDQNEEQYDEDDAEDSAEPEQITNYWATLEAAHPTPVPKRESA